MFRPLQMCHVLIQVVKSELPHTSVVLADSGIFNPDYREHIEHEVVHIPGERYRMHYRQALARFEKITSHFEIIPSHDIEEPWVVAENELVELNHLLGEVWNHCSDIDERMRGLQEKITMNNDLLNTLHIFSKLNIDLDNLHHKKRFVDIRAGVLPRENLKRVIEALSLANFIVFEFYISDNKSHVLILGAQNGQSEDVQKVLKSADFVATVLPETLQGKPDEVIDQLNQANIELQNEIEKLKTEQEQYICSIELQLQDAKSRLMMAEPLVEMGGAARTSTHVAVISGWVPKRELKNLKQRLHQQLKSPFVISVRSPEASEVKEVPTVMDHPRVMSAFATLTRQYGVPRYDEIDPSMIFAISFVLMFGMMFGDVGHGAMIMVVSLLLRKRLMQFTLFSLLSGASSIVFGFLFGSIFGYEHLIEPIWISPLTDPIYMLSVALTWGVFFLVVVSILNIYNRLNERRWLMALFDNNGVASTILYMSLLYGFNNLYQNGEFGLAASAMMILMLAGFMIYKWQQNNVPLVERIMVVFVESFETILGQISNTLSFLRLAAFSLNHVALAIAVFTIANMMGPTGDLITVVIGNLFILILEGAIVIIQALRLEYYEGFSHFYSGDGRAFAPLTIKRGNRVVIHS